VPARFQFEQWVPFPLEQVFLFFANPNNLPKIMPAKTATKIDSMNLISPPPNPEEKRGSDLRKSVKSVALSAGVGSEIVTSFRVLPYLPIRATWVALITEFQWDHHFADVQKLGPFHSFHHRHELKAEVREGVNGTVVTDKIELEVGYGWIGKAVEKLFIARQMEQMFRQRQQALPKLLAT
jgi:ligand-binding SRPBCC domain-containing protein